MFANKLCKKREATAAEKVWCLKSDVLWVSSVTRDIFGVNPDSVIYRVVNLNEEKFMTVLVTLMFLGESSVLYRNIDNFLSFNFSSHLGYLLLLANRLL